MHKDMIAMIILMHKILASNEVSPWLAGKKNGNKLIIIAQTKKIEQ